VSGADADESTGGNGKRQPVKETSAVV